MYYDGGSVRIYVSVCTLFVRKPRGTLFCRVLCTGCRLATGYIPPLMDCKYNNEVVVVVAVVVVGVSGIRTWLPENAGAVFTARG